MKVKAKVNDSFVIRKTENGELIKACIEFETNESVDIDQFKEVEIDVPIVHKKKLVLSSGKELFLTEQEMKDLREVFAYPAYFPFPSPQPSPYPYPIITCNTNVHN